jgi:hypothetical protein
MDKPDVWASCQKWWKKYRGWAAKGAARDLVLLATALALAILVVVLIPGSNNFFKDREDVTKVALELLTMLGVAVGACFALRRWDNEQRWKRRTAVLERIKAFADTPGAFNAQLMLQGRTVRVPLWDRTVSANPYTFVTPEEVAAALTPEPVGRNWPQNDRHDAIRHSVNDYLGRLADIDAFVSQARVLDQEDVRRISERLNEDMKRLVTRAPHAGVALWCYMDRYGFADVIAFAEAGEKRPEQDYVGGGVPLRTLVIAAQERLTRLADEREGSGSTPLVL